MFHRNRLASLTAILTIVGSSGFAQSSRAVLDDKIQAGVDRYIEQTLEYRHRIHQNPELGNREFETAKLVAHHLRELGMQVETGIAHTGVTGVMVGGRPGPVIAVRADMDGLPVTEDTDLPFKSEARAVYNEQDVGVMHACGHDVHTAVQLGVASILAELKDELPGTVVFLFQPAEEGPPPGEEGGAQLMVQEGVLADPAPVAVFGLHTLASLPVGQLGFTSGPALAAVDHFKVIVRGVQTHGAAPHQGVDPIVMAAQVVLGLQTIPSRTIDPIEPAVVTVGMVHGGQRFNIIPAEVRLEGTVRTYSPEVRDTVERRMREIVEGITSSAGGEYSLEYNRGTPATINNPELGAQMTPTLQAVLPPDGLVMLPPTMGGEDFAYFANEVPGFFYRLGTLKQGTTSGPHHSPTFRADDDSVAIGMRAMANVLVDYLYAAAQK